MSDIGKYQRDLLARAEQAEAAVARLRASAGSEAKLRAAATRLLDAMDRNVDPFEEGDAMVALQSLLTAPQPTPPKEASVGEAKCAKCGGTGYITHAAQQIGPGTVYGYLQVSCPDCFAKKVPEPPAPSQPAAASDAVARGIPARVVRMRELLDALDNDVLTEGTRLVYIMALVHLLAEDAIAGARGGQAS